MGQRRGPCKPPEPGPHGATVAAMATPPRQPSTVGDRLCVAAGVAGVLWLPVSLWPDLGAPAWPAVSLGVLALVLGLQRQGRVLWRGLGSVFGFCAVVGGAVQIAIVWGAMEVLGRFQG